MLTMTDLKARNQTPRHQGDARVVYGPAETPYSGFFQLDLHRFSFEQFDGKMSDQVAREVLDRGNSVAILPYDPHLDRVMLIRQFLIGAELAKRPNRPLQVIAGMVDKGETALDTARREAVEEAGLKVHWIRPAQAFLPSPGGTSEYVETFAAMADLSGPLGRRGTFGVATENENMVAEVLTAEDAIAHLDAGKIEAGPAVVLLQWFARFRDTLRADWG